MTDRFTAWSMCPHCRSLDCHGLRAPRPFDWTDPLAVLRDRMVMLSWVYGLGMNKMVPSMEPQYEVIRTCNGCGHEWGQV
ncbi:hypothetical protein [Nocardia niwae]|uniref:hypothetical protein n=1 Tax=Nocardia niwae TaxID=626084 RepID=UPI000A8C1180|nr:hypothetical protein [Nocardia niwae]